MRFIFRSVCLLLKISFCFPQKSHTIFSKVIPVIISKKSKKPQYLKSFFFVLL